MKKHPYDFAKPDSETPDDPESQALGKRSTDAPGEVLDDKAAQSRVTSEQEVKLAMAEVEEMRLRALAEADNARKRFLREKDEAVRFAASGVLSDIIPALDNLDLALEHARDNAACKDFFVGVEMTRKLMLEALQKHGLTRVGEVGDEFDPALHEALSMVVSDDLDPGRVCAILNRGYKLHDRLLRPAKVLVSRQGSHESES